MRMAANILLAGLFLLTGMQLSVMSRFCRGQLVAVKVSAAIGSESCYNENESPSALPHVNQFKSHLRKKGLAKLDADSSNYIFIARSIKIFQKISLWTSFPPVEIANLFNFIKNSFRIFSPPGAYLVSVNRLQVICVLLI